MVDSTQIHWQDSANKWDRPVVGYSDDTWVLRPREKDFSAIAMVQSIYSCNLIKNLTWTLISFYFACAFI